MILNRQYGLAADISPANRVGKVAGPVLRTHRPQPRTCWQEGLLSPPGWGDLAGYLLAWAAALAFCSGLFGLAMSPRFGAVVPRWLILAYGMACALLALLAPQLSRRGQQLQPLARQHCCPLKGVDADGCWAATWKGPPGPRPLPRRFPDLINDDKTLLESSFVVPTECLGEVAATVRASGPA
jgi:hypothetical protein